MFKKAGIKGRTQVRGDTDCKFLSCPLGFYPFRGDRLIWIEPFSSCWHLSLKLASPKTATATHQSPLATKTTYATLRIREVPAVRRAAAILNLLANNTSGLNASHIARELGIVQSTCLHILSKSGSDSNSDMRASCTHRRGGTL